MNEPELKEFRKSITTLEKRSLREYSALLGQVGNYYRLTIPSEIDLEYVKETERLLNNLYVKVTGMYTPSEIQANIKQTLGIASSINFAIKLRNFGPETFTLLKDLSEALLVISANIVRLK